MSAENSLLTRAAENSHRQGPEVCPSRKAAGHFQTVTNSDLRLQTSDSEHEHEQQQERCIRASSFLRHFMSLSGGFASRQSVASCYGSLHPNHWSLTSPGLAPAT